MNKLEKVKSWLKKSVKDGDLVKVTENTYFREESHHLKLNPSKWNKDELYLGLDSLETVDLIMECEKECGISISDDQIEKIYQVKDIFPYIPDEQN